MKKLALVLGLILVFGLVLGGCNGVTPTPIITPTPTPTKADLEVTITPNPVPYENGSWKGTITFSEKNGIGVTINNITVSVYDASGNVIQTLTTEMEAVYISGGSSSTDSFEWDESMGIFSKIEYVFSGKDDNGNDIQATLTVVLQPPQQ